MDAFYFLAMLIGIAWLAVWSILPEGSRLSRWWWPFDMEGSPPQPAAMTEASPPREEPRRRTAPSPREEPRGRTAPSPREEPRGRTAPPPREEPEERTASPPRGGGGEGGWRKAAASAGAASRSRRQ